MARPRMTEEEKLARRIERIQGLTKPLEKQQQLAGQLNTKLVPEDLETNQLEIYRRLNVIFRQLGILGNATKIQDLINGYFASFSSS